MVTAPGSGAEIIPFLKTWVNLPAAIGFTVLYAKVTIIDLSCILAADAVALSCHHRLSLLLTPVSAPVQLANILSTEKLFYACIIPFIIFFGAFAFVLYPMREALHPTGALMW